MAINSLWEWLCQARAGDELVQLAASRPPVPGAPAGREWSVGKQEADGFHGPGHSNFLFARDSLTTARDSSTLGDQAGRIAQDTLTFDRSYTMMNGRSLRYPCRLPGFPSRKARSTC
jgi:hypothetical protein